MNGNIVGEEFEGYVFDQIGLRQEAQAKGKAFKVQVEEDRRNSDIEYQISKEMGAAQREAQANANKSAAIGGIFSGIGDIAGSVIGAGGAGG